LEGQSLLILNPENKVLLKTKAKPYLKDLDLSQIHSEKDSFFPIRVKDEILMVNKLYSEKLRTIISILESAEKGRPLPPLSSRVKDVYSYIIQRILKNFIEQNFLKVQLSERRYKTQAMEFLALQSQLNPHFLYNTLDTINWKAASMTGGPNELNTIVENLSDILRYSLDGQNNLVTLQKEIAYTFSYINIQKIRYKDKFDVIWEYDDKVLKYHIMKLIFQPFIENSLYHGIKEKEGTGLIKVKIKARQTRLCISIVDNGIGMLPERLKHVREKLRLDQDQTRHIGLFNTHRRLKLTYGDSFGVKLNSKFGWGTALYITIPID
jgi:two-component system sensor histidine kinase YesM